MSLLKFKIAEYRLHQWLPEFEQKSECRIHKFEKISYPDPDSKILEQVRSRNLKM